MGRKQRIYILWVSTDTPHSAGDEFFVVLLFSFCNPPSGLLVVGDNLKEEGSSKETKRGIVTQTKSGMS